MRFDTDDDRLSMWLQLDPDEYPRVNLAALGLGRECLDCLTRSLRRIWESQGQILGRKWAPLKQGTQAHKRGRGVIGLDTGSMVGQVHPGKRLILPRSATWRFPDGDRYDAASAFHNGNGSQQARPWFVWTAAAMDEVADVLDRASR